MHPSHVIVIAVLEGRILHETVTYRWLGGLQYTKGRYFVDAPDVVVYGLFSALSGTTVYVSNNDRTDYTALENYLKLKEVIASPVVADLIY